MIYTVTLNPALDYTLFLNRLCPGELNRCTAQRWTPGGKGINVSRVLTAMGVSNRAWGFAAGETGGLLESLLRQQGVDAAFIHLPSGSTRVNVKLEAAEETELNAPGCAVDEDSFARLCEQLRHLRAGDVLCLCGSVPPGLPPDVYRQLLESLQNKGVRTIVDTAGDALSQALPGHPWMIKPNRQELEALAGRPLPDIPAVTEAAAQLQRQGAENVLVSLGKDGGVLVTADGEWYHCPAPTGTVRGTVGAGDSMVAGMAAAVAKGLDVPRALELAVAVGSATAFSPELAGREQLEPLCRAFFISEQEK